jgi:hypothetical protein
MRQLYFKMSSLLMGGVKYTLQFSAKLYAYLLTGILYFLSGDFFVLTDCITNY